MTYDDLAGGVVMADQRTRYEAGSWWMSLYADRGDDRPRRSLMPETAEGGQLGLPDGRVLELAHGYGPRPVWLDGERMYAADYEPVPSGIDLLLWDITDIPIG